MRDAAGSAIASGLHPWHLPHIGKGRPETCPTSASTDSHSYRRSRPLVVLAFSLRGVPDPVEPPAGNARVRRRGGREVDSRRARARRVARSRAARRTTPRPTSSPSASARSSSGTLGEQTVEADDRRLRGRRASKRDPDASRRLGPRDRRHRWRATPARARAHRRAQRRRASSSSSSTSSSVAERNRTLILASTSGASAEARGSPRADRGPSRAHDRRRRRRHLPARLRRAVRARTS